MARLCNVVNLSQTQDEAINECWTILFDHYFDILKISHLYKVEINTFYRKIVEPNSQAKPRERKESLIQSCLLINEEDLKK